MMTNVFDNLFLFTSFILKPNFNLKNNENENLLKNLDKFLFTCVCVSPSEAANSARSGKARYCVR